MDIFAVIGMFFGITMILIGQAMEGGNIGQLLQITAFFIVIGGTMSFMNVYPYYKQDTEAPYFTFPYIVPYKEEYGEPIKSNGYITKYENFEISYDDINDIITFMINGKTYTISDYRDLYSQPYSRHCVDDATILNFETLQCEGANTVKDTSIS